MQEIAMGVDGAGWEVGLWLETLSLEEHAAVFQRERFDTLHDLNAITEADLTAMEIPRGHLRRIMAALPATLPEETPEPASAEAAAAVAAAASPDSVKGKGKAPRPISHDLEELDLGGGGGEEEELDFGGGHAAAGTPDDHELDFSGILGVTFLTSNGGKIYNRTGPGGWFVHGATGNKYKGEQKEGKMHGQGHFASANGEVYAGMFCEGVEHGQGMHTWPDQTRYVARTRTRAGILLTCACGWSWLRCSQHVGACGHGCVALSSRTQDALRMLTLPPHFSLALRHRYEGGWRHGKEDGMGTLSFPGGDQYIGQFKRGSRHGQGTMTSPDGHRYDGEWAGCRRHGPGTMSYPDGRVEAGVWEEGALVGADDAEDGDEGDGDDGDDGELDLSHSGGVSESAGAGDDGELDLTDTADADF
jgi:hypothetical protein